MISAQNIENLAQGKDHPENALLAAREIVKRMCIEWDDAYDLEEVFSGFSYDGLVLVFESIIAHQYSEEPRDESIPFS
jgi:hypothetical protein